MMFRLLLQAYAWLWAILAVGAFALGVPPVGVLVCAGVAVACTGVWLVAERGAAP